MQWLGSLGWIDFSDLHNIEPKVWFVASGPLGPARLDLSAAYLYSGCARRLAGTRPQFHLHLPAHRHLRHGLLQVIGGLGQAPIPKPSNHEIHSMALAPLDRLVKIGLPIGNVCPLAARRWSPAGFEHLGPTLRFSRPTDPLAPILSSFFGWPLAGPAALPK